MDCWRSRNYPLFCVSINLTKMVIEALLAGPLGDMTDPSDKNHMWIEWEQTT